MHYGLVGDGRVARHLAHYFDLSGISWTGWARNTDDVSVAEKLQSCDIILLAVADGAIDGLAAMFDDTRPLVHFSGCATHDRAVGLHPLASFGDALFDLNFYQQIPFVGEKGRATLGDIFPALPNPFFEIAAEQKPLYHALCAMAGNFSVMLWQKLFFDLQKLGIEGAAMMPFLQSVTQNLTNDPVNALTGPVVRGDKTTVAAHLTALQGDEAEKLYQAFIEFYANKNPPSAKKAG